MEKVTLNNAVVIYEEDSKIKELFCPKEEAETLLSKIQVAKGGVVVLSSDNCDMKMLFCVSPDLRKRVKQAKKKLAADVFLRDILTRHNVPTAPEIRASIHKAFEEWKADFLAHAIESYATNPSDVNYYRMQDSLIDANKQALATARWVVREKSTGKALFETTDKKKVDALNTVTHEAIPILQPQRI